MRKYKDKEWLREKYVDEEMTMREIAKIINCSANTICNWIHKHEIKTRLGGGRSGGRPGHHVIFTPRELQFLDGLILGDGGLDSRPKSGRYYHGDSSKEYIHWLSRRLSQIGLENRVEERLDGYYLWTKNYRELKPQYNQWYPNGDKKTRIPDRVEITPVTLFNWFIGDGSYRQDKKNNWVLKIISTTFGEDLLRMVQQIRHSGIGCTKHRDGIYIRKESHQDFFDYILLSGIGIPPGYKYKFPDEIITGGID